MKIASSFPLALAALVLAGCGPAPQPADEFGLEAPVAEALAQAEGIAVHGPWVRQPPPSAQVAAGYLRIDNPDAEPDRLLAVQTDAAERVEIHRMEEVDGMMRMREATDGLKVPASGLLELEPGGYHLMLINPREGLEAGQHVDATLVFERAGSVEVTFEVRPPDAGAGDDGGHHPHGD